MLQELIQAFFFIFVAEMGDKTQILAMTFATQYRTRKVLLGVFIGSAFNHGIAIVLGTYLSKAIPLDTVQLVAAVLFIMFGLWTLRDGDDEEKEDKGTNYGPVITVALAFFIGELGDKTQLTAMTLATGAKFPIFILMGTTLGMIVTSGLGIYIGSKIGDRISESTIKLSSAGVFIFFGTLKLFQRLPKQHLTTINIVVYFLILGIIIFILLRPIIKEKRWKGKTALKEVAADLYRQTNDIKKVVERICLGEKNCGECKDKIIEALSVTIVHFLDYGIYQDKDYVMNRVRENLEILAFGETIPFEGSIDRYFSAMKEKDKSLADEIILRVKKIRDVKK